MRRLYSGLLLCGAFVSANAGEMDMDLFSSRLDQSTIQHVRHIPYLLSSCWCGDSVVFIRSAGIVPVVAQKAEQKKETIHETTGRPVGLGSIRDALSYFKRVELNGERFKVTLRSDSASMETGNFKIALRSGSTLMMWSRAL